MDRGVWETDSLPGLELHGCGRLCDYQWVPCCVCFEVRFACSNTKAQKVVHHSSDLREIVKAHTELTGVEPYP
jgi:hypothetical protein